MTKEQRRQKQIRYRKNRRARTPAREVDVSDAIRTLEILMTCDTYFADNDWYLRTTKQGDLDVVVTPRKGLYKNITEYYESRLFCAELLRLLENLAAERARATVKL